MEKKVVRYEFLKQFQVCRRKLRNYICWFRPLETVTYHLKRSTTVIYYINIRSTQVNSLLYEYTPKRLTDGGEEVYLPSFLT
jgi:hypothetical protein